VTRLNGRLLRSELPSLPFRAYSGTRGSVFFPSPPGAVLHEALLGLLEGRSQGRVAHVLDVRWAVSFHRRGLRERYVTRHRSASPHARPLLGGGAFTGNGEVARYALKWSGWWIDYDRERLRADGNPLPDPALFHPPKIVICQNGRTLRAAYDADGHVLKDTFLCGVPRPVDHPLCRHPRALVGLLCSRAIHFFYSHVFFGGHVNGGYLHFLSSFLGEIPLGRWSPETAAETARLVLRRETAGCDEERDIEAAIEAQVRAALDLSEEQEAAIESWARADENWLARDRVGRGSSKRAGQPDRAR
jgi:hypothetical protein